MPRGRDPSSTRDMLPSGVMPHRSNQPPKQQRQDSELKPMTAKLSLKYKDTLSGNPIKFLETSKYSDFSIRCGQFTFKVHKYVIASGSEYFDKVCSGPFSEASENVVNLQEDEPSLVARMILYLYTSKYGQGHGQQYPLHQLLSQAADDPDAADRVLSDVDELILAAQMYGIGDRYAVEGLKELSHGRFLELLPDTPTPPNILLPLIDVVYDTTAEGDDRFRKWVVWRSQGQRQELIDRDDFVDMIQRRPDFATDLITKYAARNYVWCPECQKYINLECCNCGLSGICGKTECCTKADLTALTCTNCKKNSVLQLRRSTVAGPSPTPPLREK